MSIDKLAHTLAKKGRHGDDLLVHMSRNEVAGLQALASAHGTSLTVNPETGLPEAFSLKSILPSLAGAAAGFFTMNPYIGAGVSALATKGMGGSDKAALLSGLGSYFGAANMGSNLASAATEGVGTSAMQEGAAQGVGEAALPEAGMLGAEAAPTVGPSVEQMTADNQGLLLGEAQPGMTPAERWGQLAPQEQMSRVGDVSFDQWKDKMGGWGGVGKAGIAALGTAGATEAVDNQYAPQKLKMGIQEYRFDPQLQRNVPVDSREQKHFGNVFTKGAYRDVSAAEGGIMRLAAGGVASTTGGYKPEQVYGAGQSGAYTPQSGAYTPQSVYGVQAAQPQPASNTQKLVFDPKTGGFSINPEWQKAQSEPAYAAGGVASLGDYSDGGRLLRGPGDGVSDSIPAHIDGKRPARLADGEFVVPARAVSELGNGSTEAGSKKLYGMLDRIQKARGKTTGKNGIAKNTNPDKLLPA